MRISETVLYCRVKSVMRTLSVVCAVLLLASAPASASAYAYGVQAKDPDALKGFWQGTVGGRLAHVCFANGRMFGSFYFVGEENVIPLELAEQKDAKAFFLLQETPEESGAVTSANSPPSRIWEIGSIASEKVLRGVRKGVEGTQTQLIELKLRSDAVTQSSHSLSCLEPFYAPVIEKEKHRPNGKKSVGGHTFSLYTLPTIEAFAVPSSITGAPSINKQIDTWVREQLRQNIDCTLGAKPYAGMSNQFSPVLVSKRFLVTADKYEIDCFGAHPSDGIRYATYDMQSGELLDTKKWVTQQNDPSTMFAPSKPVLNLIYRYYRKPKGIRDIPCMAEGGFIDPPHPRAEGLGFRISYGNAAKICASHSIIPWSKVAPLLTPAGRVSLAEWIEKRKSR